MPYASKALRLIRRRISLLRMPAGRTTYTSSVPGVHLHAAPRSTLMDEVVSVRVSDLQPGQRVTLVTRLQEAGNRFLGHAWYTADDRGTVDVQTAESTGGSYTGILKQEPAPQVQVMATYGREIMQANSACLISGVRCTVFKKS